MQRLYWEWQEKNTAERRAEIDAAIKGILGMMKFGNHKAPILLEALGSLLQYGYEKADAKFLSCRAFLKASYEVPDGPSRIAYRAMAKSALMSKAGGKFATQISLKEVEPDFKAELADAERWYEEVRATELAAIRDGKNPDAEFDKLYELELPMRDGGRDTGTGVIWIVGLILVGVGAALTIGWLAVARLRRTSTTTTRPSSS